MISSQMLLLKVNCHYFNLHRHSLFNPLYATCGSFAKKPHSLCVYVSIRPTSGGSTNLFFTPFYATHGSFGPGNVQRNLTGYTSPLDQRRDLTIQKVRVANKNHEKSNIVVSSFLTICNERKMVCGGMQRGFVIQMTIIKRSETYLKRWTHEWR